MFDASKIANKVKNRDLRLLNRTIWGDCADFTISTRIRNSVYCFSIKKEVPSTCLSRNFSCLASASRIFLILQKGPFGCVNRPPWREQHTLCQSGSSLYGLERGAPPTAHRLSLWHTDSSPPFSLCHSPSSDYYSHAQTAYTLCE